MYVIAPACCSLCPFLCRTCGEERKGHYPISLFSTNFTPLSFFRPLSLLAILSPISTMHLYIMFPFSTYFGYEATPEVSGNKGTWEQKENKTGNTVTNAYFREQGTPQSKKYFYGTQDHKEIFVGNKGTWTP